MLELLSSGNDEFFGDNWFLCQGYVEIYFIQFFKYEEIYFVQFFVVQFSLDEVLGIIDLWFSYVYVSCKFEVVGCE